jgi:cytoskeletal protein CcmA (bactofilin family)
MLRNELPIRIHRVGAASTLPIPVFTKLSNARARLRHELTLGMPLYKLPVAVDGVGRLRGAPILLLTAAASAEQHQTQTNRSTSCPDCDHRQHLPLAATGYCNDAPTEQGSPRTPGAMMSDMPKRRLIDQLGSSPTFVAEGCHLTGDVETGGPLVVCGAIRGDGKVGGALSMAAKSQWEGEIHALAAVIAGRIYGKLVVENKLEVGATAVIHADIIAKSIAIAKGAVIDGAVTVTSGQPVIQFEEKRG